MKSNRVLQIVLTGVATLVCSVSFGVKDRYASPSDSDAAPPSACERILKTDLAGEERLLRDALARGEVRRLSLVEAYAIDMNRLTQGLAANPFLQESFGGDASDSNLGAVEEQMQRLAGIVSQFSPATPATSPVARIGSALSRLVRSQSSGAILARFRNHEGMIRDILTGLDRGRTGLITDNALIDDEIGAIQTKMEEILSAISDWEARRQMITSVIADLEQRIAETERTSGDPRRDRMQLDIVKTQLLLPIEGTLQALEGRYDVFQALVVAKRGQQNQNSQTIQTTQNLVQTAAEILPAIVSSAVTAARQGRVMAANRAATDMMHAGLEAITSQMRANQVAGAEAMRSGPISQERIERFREDVLAILKEKEAADLETLAQIQEMRRHRDELMAREGPRLQALMQGSEAATTPEQRLEQP